MDTKSIQALLEGAFPGASVSVELSGGHCNVQVISTEFDGLRSVTRQTACIRAAGGLYCVRRDSCGQYFCQDPRGSSRVARLFLGQVTHSGWSPTGRHT